MSQSLAGKEQGNTVKCKKMAVREQAKQCIYDISFM